MINMLTDHYATALFVALFLVAVGLIQHRKAGK
jgi:hypothetical protein